MAKKIKALVENIDFFLIFTNFELASFLEIWKWRREEVTMDQKYESQMCKEAFKSIAWVDFGTHFRGAIVSKVLL